MTTFTPVADHVLSNLRATLAASLPGLSRTQLEDLAVHSHAELCERLGNALASNLAPSQLADFERLVDDDVDDDAVEAWFHSNVPYSRVTAACLRADLLAEVIKTAATADPSAVEGVRVVDELAPISLDVIEQWLLQDEITCHRAEHAINIEIENKDSGLQVAITIRLIAYPARVLKLTGRAMKRSDGPRAAAETLDDFVAAWNAYTALPKAVIRQVGSSPTWIEGEISVPYPKWSTRQHVIAVIAQFVEAMYAMLDQLHEALGEIGETPESQNPKEPSR